MDILEINTEKRYVRVEPMVTIGRLMRALVDRGWMVPIVPEIGKVYILNTSIVVGTLHLSYGILSRNDIKTWELRMFCLSRRPNHWRSGLRRWHRVHLSQIRALAAHLHQVRLNELYLGRSY